MKPITFFVAIAIIMLIGSASAAWYPLKNQAETIQTDVPGMAITLGKVVMESWAGPVATDDDRLLAATATNNRTWTNVTTFLAQPDVARALTITAGGTAADIKGSSIIVKGRNIAGQSIMESFAVTENTAGAIVGSKAFKTITEVDIPAQDGNASTFKVGINDKLGLKNKMAINTVLLAALNNAREGSAPTVAVSSSAVESNTVDLNSALDGNPVKVFYIDY